MPAHKLLRQHSARRTNPNAWMVTFSDLLLLLITFFVMLLTMKSMDNRPLNEIFKTSRAIQGPVEQMEIQLDGDVPQVMGLGQKPVIFKNAEKLKKRLEAMQSAASASAEKDRLAEAGEIIDITEDHRGVVVTLGTDHLFESGKAGINPDRLHVLDTIAKLLGRAANTILVMGHTDNMPTRGERFDSNWELSFYRALSVFYYLADSRGLKPGKLAVGGYGEQMPRYPNDTEENRAGNRRVEFILKKPG